MNLQDSNNLSSLDEKDLIRFHQEPIFEISKMRNVFKSIFKNDFNTIINQHLKNFGVAIRRGALVERDNEKIEITNNWFEKGVVCNVLRLGTSDWILGRLKVKIEIEFEEITEKDLEELSNNTDEKLNAKFNADPWGLDQENNTIDSELEELRRKLNLL